MAKALVNEVEMAYREEMRKLRAENKKLRGKRHITLTQAREQALFVKKKRDLEKKVETLTAENKAKEQEIERLKEAFLLPVSCPNGGTHIWRTKCKKCKMQVLSGDGE
ncbi:MAG: hypothetical protein ACYS21_20910 [Planctomycetota bacterium]|jgi:cell division protein FtsB